MPQLQTSENPGAGSLVRIFTLLGVVIFLGTGLFWWPQKVNSEKSVFYSMLDNSMRSRGVSKRSIQSDGVQQLDQTLQLQNGGQNVVHARTILSQQQGASAVVTTESIGTPAQDFVRYSSIETNQTNANGEAYNFSDVIGVWGAAGGSAQGTTGELFGEASLGVVPFGYVPQSQRKEILNFIKEKNVYEINFDDVDRKSEDGRPQYVYNVSVQPEKYIEMLQKFGRAVGLKQLEAFKPESFAGSPALQFQLVVDIWSRQLAGVSFSDSPRTEEYSGFGAKDSVELPTETISVQELQLRLQAAE